MSYEPKKQPCNFCKGKKKVRIFSMAINLDPNKAVSEKAQALAEAMRNDDNCPQCNGAGEVNAPPYNDGIQVKMTEEVMSELVSAATLLRCFGDAIFIQAIANEAARISLPTDMVDTYAAYWVDPGRAITVGEYVFQVAQSAEELALATYGDLGNRLYAYPRPTPT